MNRSLASSSLACGCSCRTYWLPASIVEAVHDWTKAKRLLIGALRIIPMSTSSASRLVSGDCVFIVSLPLAHSTVESVANTREEVKRSFHVIQGFSRVGASKQVKSREGSYGASLEWANGHRSCAISPSSPRTPRTSAARYAPVYSAPARAAAPSPLTARRVRDHPAAGARRRPAPAHCLPGTAARHRR